MKDQPRIGFSTINVDGDSDTLLADAEPRMRQGHEADDDEKADDKRRR